MEEKLKYDHRSNDSSGGSIERERERGKKFRNYETLYREALVDSAFFE